VSVTLEFQSNPEIWRIVGRGETDPDGRVSNLLNDAEPALTGTYRLTFGTGEYFDRVGVKSFHPSVEVVFDVSEVDDHYHVPILLSPFGYTTYRGS